MNCWRRLNYKGRSLHVGFDSLLAVIFASLLLAPAPINPAEKSKGERVVQDGTVVILEYTQKGTDGKVIESSKGSGPLKYIHGQNLLPPGLEKAITGMKVGEQKKITVKPEEGYGKFDPKAIKELPRDEVPANGLKVGAVLAYRNPDGSIAPMRVRQIKEKTVVMDMNHPMAGKTLIFDVKVIDIQAPQLPQGPQPAAPAAPSKPTAPAQPAKPAAPATK